MHVIVPVKSFENAKMRLSKVLTLEQRIELSDHMLNDILHTLHTSDDVQGVTIVSSDKSIQELAENYQAGFIQIESDGGYSEDATHALNTLDSSRYKTIGIIPADVPQLSHADLSKLAKNHTEGITLCPAIIDGGTNAMIFNVPLPVPLMFGKDSLETYRSFAVKNNIPVNVELIKGLERDVDRPEDLLWLSKQSSGGKAWSFIKNLTPPLTE
jgi:2-phospho-L-lactate/phosphoenolpyruvate guanylyltransferase